MDELKQVLKLELNQMISSKIDEIFDRMSQESPTLVKKKLKKVTKDDKKSPKVSSKSGWLCSICNFQARRPDEV